MNCVSVSVMFFAFICNVSIFFIRLQALDIVVYFMSRIKIKSNFMFNTFISRIKEIHINNFLVVTAQLEHRLVQLGQFDHDLKTA